MNTYADIDCIPLFRRLKKAPERRPQYYAVLDSNGFVDRVYKVGPKESAKDPAHIHLGDFPRIRNLALRDDERVPLYRVHNGKLREAHQNERNAWKEARVPAVTPAQEAAALQGALISVLLGAGNVADVIEQAYRQGKLTEADVDKLVQDGKLSVKEAQKITKVHKPASIPFENIVEGA